MQRRRVVEDHVHVGVHQVRHVEEDLALDVFLVRLQKVHRPAQVLQLQLLFAWQKHFLGQPLPATVQLRARLTGAVGYHRKQCPLEWLPPSVLRLQLAEHPIDSQLTPNRLHDVDGAVGPGIEHGNTRFGSHHLFTRQHTQNATGEAAHRHAIHLVGSAEVVDHFGDGAAPIRIPRVLRELVVLDGGAVSILAASGAQVHA